MKKLFTLLAAVTLSVMLFAQAPQSFSYQTVIRDANWTVLDNKSLGIKISILVGILFKKVFLLNEFTYKNKGIYSFRRISKNRDIPAVSRRVKFGESA